MANLNTALTPSPVVTVVNKDGTTATGYTGNVTMALGTNPTNATLGGTTVVAASSGVATFSNLTLNRSGKNFTLRATAAAQGGYTPKARVSRPFSIPTRCVFTTQPVGVAVPNAIIPPFQVSVQDSAGNTDTNYNGEITLALYAGAALGILSGLFIRNAVNGVADFSGLSIDASGDYSLRATAEESNTAYSPAPAISNTFPVGPYTLTVIADISDLNVKTAFTTKYGAIPSGAYTLNVNIASGVVISSTSTSNAALTWGSSWGGTPTFTLTNLGYVLGRGGAGGVGSAATSTTFTNGGNGGAAFELSGNTVSITNASGYIWGGGGGGGGGGRYNVSGVGTAPTGGADLAGGGGAAGAGIPSGSGGGAAGAGSQVSGTGTLTSAAQIGANQTGALISQTGVGTEGVGTIPSPGQGGIAGIAGFGLSFGNMYGGNSGGYGEDGFEARQGSGYETSGGTGGTAGKAINLSAGTATFISGSGSPNVKGAVS